MEPPKKRFKASSSEGSTSTPALSRSTSGAESIVEHRLTSLALPSRLRAILPAATKPAAPPIRRNEREERPSESLVIGACGIPICKRLPCTLNSHRRYAKTLLDKSRRSRKNSRAGLQRSVTGHRGHTSPSSIVLTLSKAGGFPELPLNGLDKQHPILRKLFHDFFITVVDKLHVLLRPPGPNAQSWRKQRQQHLFNTATGSTVDCINLIGTAHNYSVNNPRIDDTGHTTGIVIQSQLMQLLRDMLNDYDPRAHAEHVLSIILTVAIADLAAGRSERLLAHRQAMIRVIDSCGGIHNISQVIPLAMNLDRILAVTNALPPLSTTWANVTIPVQRAPLYPAVYDSFFSCGDKGGRVDLIDKDISSYCAEVCRAIEILEGENWAFSTDATNTGSSEIFYFYYLRDRVTGQFAHLNARFADADSREQCVLLATKIVEYTLFMDNYIAAIPIILAKRVQSILVKHDLDEVWRGWEDVLMWIALVLVCMPNQWSGRTWSIEFCCRTLRRSCGTEWPDGSDWRRRALTQVRSFVWSKRLDDALTAACVGLTDVATTEP